MSDPKGADTPARRVHLARLTAGAALLLLVAGCGSLTKDTDTTGQPESGAGTAASFTAHTTSGETTTLPGNRPAVLLFFSVECGGCGPTAQAIAQARAADPAAADFAVVDIAGYETARDVEGFLATNQAEDLAYAIDTDGTLLSAYEVTQLSTVLVLDAHGGVAYRGVEPSVETITDELAKATEG